MAGMQEIVWSSCLQNMEISTLTVEIIVFLTMKGILNMEITLVNLMERKDLLTFTVVILTLFLHMEVKEVIVLA